MTLSRVLICEEAAVASEQPLASLAGYDVLRKGGNAIDAAVATSFALGVTFHPAGGLGGDFFATIYEAKTGKIHCINSSGWSPSGLTLDLVRSRGGESVPLLGPTSAVVPGMITGVCAMHVKLGSSELAGLLGAAQRYASDGFPMGEGMAKSTAANLPSLSPAAKKVFAPTGAPPSAGEWVRQANLGKVIADVAEGGAEAFYRGWPAEAIAEELSALGVPTKKTDFASFEPEWVKPLEFDYRGTTVYETPPNSMGATSLLMLEHLSRDDMSRVGADSAERVSRTMEAAEFAYARRDEMLGDPRFVGFDFKRFMDLGGARGVAPEALADGDTTAFSVVDGEGNIVSAIQSLFHHYGSKVFVEKTGIMLNNRAAGFKMAGPNKVEPLKRPLHTLSSMLLARGGEPTTAIGCSGGEFRPIQHTLFVTNMVDYSMTLEQSIDFPRFVWSGGRELIVEAGLGVPGRRYDVTPQPHPGRTGVCQGVQVTGRARKAVCDVRNDGIPAGF
jgi:gamma-glutamyltranspeptidase / glutathione hydrolase